MTHRQHPSLKYYDPKQNQMEPFIILIVQSSLNLHAFRFTIIKDYTKEELFQVVILIK